MASCQFFAAGRAAGYGRARSAVARPAAAAGPGASHRADRDRRREGARGVAIGRAVAAALLQNGTHVAISGINKEHLERAEAELSRVAAAG